MQKKIKVEVYVNYDLPNEDDDFSLELGEDLNKIAKYITDGFEAGGSDGTILKWSVTEEVSKE